MPPISIKKGPIPICPPNKKVKSFFNKSNEEATKIMLHVHQNGIGVCGVFSYEIAETKVIQVLDTSRKNNHPLQCTMEKA